MMKHCVWILSLFLAVACGGKSRGDGSSTSRGGGTATAAGSASGGAASTSSAGTGNTGAGNGGSCPESKPAPDEGSACPTPGLSCPGYGTLSCPLTAVCSVDSKWQINCPSTMIFGPCSCPHHDFGRVPSEHRAEASSCSHARAPGLEAADGSTLPNSECSKDADCTNGALGDNGRCVQSGPIPGYVCSYDACFEDSACANGSVCQCRQPTDGVAANYCTPTSNCRIDADCGDNGYCSPSQSHEWCGTFYACHTPNDECLNDNDCGTNLHCDFDDNAKHWVCANLCGPVPP